MKNWNKGKLSDKYYQHDGAHTSQETASASTSYRWAFASGDKVSDKDIRGAREAVKEATNGTMTLPSRPVHGPSLPGSNDRTGAGSDTQYEKELMEDRKRVEGIMSRKRAREEENDRLEDLVGPRAVGREKMQENKKARRENDRAFREKDAEPDIDADTLMGGDSFQARYVFVYSYGVSLDGSLHGRLAQRDAARKRFDEKRGGDREAREAATRERTSAIREKEKATMDMFKALAKERFG